MEAAKLSANICLYYPWQIAKKLNGTVFGVYAIQNLVSSLLLASKTFCSYHDIPTPRIDYVIDLLKQARYVFTNVPITLLSATTTLRSVQKTRKSPKTPSYKNLCKNISLVTGLFAKTIGLVQFIDACGGSIVASCTRWDIQYLGAAAKFGGSPLFGSLDVFRAHVTIVGIVLGMVHAQMTFTKRDAKTPEELNQMDPYKHRLYEHRHTIRFFKLAGGTCKIACILAAGSTTWPAIGLYLVSSVIQISNEYFKTYKIGERGKIPPVLESI